MPARIENELKINKSIENMLQDMPQYVVEWHDNLHASKLTASSRRNYVTKIRAYLESINRNVSKVKIEDITAQSVRKHYIAIATKETSNGEIKSTSDSYQLGVYAALNNFLAFLVGDGYIKQNYMEKIKRPKNKDLDRIKLHRVKLDERDFKLVLHKAAVQRDPIFRYRDGLVLRLLMETGMRETALRIINISDIDFENKTILTYDKGSNEGNQQLYEVSDSVIEAINNWLQYRSCFEKRPTDALFLNYQGTRLSTKGISRIVDKYFYEALGKHVSPHKIRGGFASIMYTKTGGDLEFVKELMGHKEVMTTDRYLAFKNDSRKRAIDLLKL